MDTNDLKNADYLDIIFNNRNKKYGGYELRRHYNRRVGKAAGMLFGTLAIVSLLLAFRKPDMAVKHREREVIIQPTWYPPVEEMKKPEVVQPAKSPVRAKSEILTDPVITKDNKPDDKVMANVDQLRNSTAGLGNDIDTASLGFPGDGPTANTGTAIIEEKKPIAPVMYVPHMPAFDGDLNVYLGKNVHYPDQAREAGIDGRVLVNFVVNEDGKVTDAKIIHGVGGGCDEEAIRVIAAMPRWKPGLNNGIPVKVYFNLAIKFELH